MPCVDESPICQPRVLTPFAKLVKAMTASAVPLASTRIVALYFDSCASHLSTPFREDFITLDESATSGTLDGIASGLEIKGTGIVRYVMQDDTGTNFTLEAQGYWVPQLKCRLVSPQDLHTIEGNPVEYRSAPGFEGVERFADLKIKPAMRGYSDMDPLQTCTMQFNRSNNLPIHTAQLPNAEAWTAQALGAAICETSKHNHNLDAAQKELLFWHFRLGHIGFAHIRFLARSGKLPVKNPKMVANCDKVLCSACQFGKASRRPAGTSKQIKDPLKEMELKKNDLTPGQRVSVDHFQSALPGRLYSSKGGTDRKDMYHGGSIFADHASGYIQVRHQVSLSAEDSIKAKLSYEQDSADAGVFVKAYHTDNGVFTSKDFMHQLISSNQQIRFSGVGAAHQNGVAERSIRTVVDMARTMMIHAAMRSPQGTISADLWPMAMDHAVWIYNRIPRMDTGLSTRELWTRSTFLPTKEILATCHTWGCPTYVLEPKLQKGGVKIPKWEPRSRRGAFLGFSRMHSTMIGLILNLRTKFISPQFHVVFDDMFTTITSNEDEVVPAIWSHLLMSPSARLRVTLDQDATPELDDDWLSAEDAENRRNARRDWIQQQSKHSRDNTSLRDWPSADGATPHPPEGGATRHPPEGDHTSTVPPVSRQMEHPSSLQREQVEQPTSLQREQSSSLQREQSVSNIVPGGDGQNSGETMSRNTPSPRRSSRPTRKPKRMDLQSHKPASQWVSDHTAAVAAIESGLFSADAWDEIQGMMACQAINHGTVFSAEPEVLKSQKRSSPDEPTLMEALSSPDSEEWGGAMKVEVVNLEKRKTWDVIQRSSVPKGVKIIPGTWAFKCKRKPDGSFRKHKARFCVRGDIQKRVSEEPMNTYAPVVQWSTVRLMLVMTCILSLQTQATDFSNAFAQAELPEPVYILPPAKYHCPEWGQDPILKLNKSLYGQAEAPRLWYEKLKAGLEARGFTACIVDPCLFLSPKIICVQYVDDCLWFYRNKDDLDALLQTFAEDGDEYNWEMSVEGSVKEYLGIGIDTRTQEEGGGFMLHQSGLIKKILAATDMVNCNGKKTPTSSDAPLGTNADGPPARYEHKWSYASVVGMMMYLASNSRPEIQFAVHQCARFTHNYRASHEDAILRICRYLKETNDEPRGLILNPSDKFQVDCCVDSDFAGLYGYEDSDDPLCARSRTGYVITFANCPILWVSKLQTEIALSTLHAKYVALSQSLRDLLPFKELAKDVVKGLGMDNRRLQFITKSSTFEHRPLDFVDKSNVHEDNAGAIVVATSPRLTPTSKFIAVKYHWFCSHIDPGDGSRPIKICKILGTKNPADIFTKSKSGQKGFEDLRMILCGW